MRILKETIISAVDDNGKALVIDNVYAFDVEEGKCLYGKYKGITKRGALQFKSVLKDSDVIFNVMPASIKRITAVEVNEKVV